MSNQPVISYVPAQPPQLTGQLLYPSQPGFQPEFQPGFQPAFQPPVVGPQVTEYPVKGQDLDTQRNLDTKPDFAQAPIRFPPRWQARTVTWSYVFVQVVAIILGIAALGTKVWCTALFVTIGLNVITYSVFFEGSDTEVKLSNVVDNCESIGGVVSDCTNIKVYYICGIIMQVTGAISLVFSAAALALIIWMRLSSSFNYLKLLKFVLAIGPLLWVIGVAAMIAGFVILNSDSNLLLMSSGYRVAFSSLALLFGTLVFSCWKLKPLKNPNYASVPPVVSS